MKRILTALLIAPMLCAIGFFATAVAPATPVVAAAPISEQEAAYAAEVAAFTEKYPEPISGGSSVGEVEEYAEAMHAYWSAVPWDAVAGQWGCTVEVTGPSHVQQLSTIETDGGDVLPAGTTLAQMNFITDDSCGAGLTDDILKVEPRVPDQPDFAPMAWNDSCGYQWVSLTTLCLGRNGSTVAMWSWTNNAAFGTHTANDQLWNATPGCAASSGISSTGNVTLAVGQRNTAQITVNYNSTFLNLLYSWNGSSYTGAGSHCHTM